MLPPHEQRKDRIIDESLFSINHFELSGPLYIFISNNTKLAKLVFVFFNTGTWLKKDYNVMFDFSV